MSNEFDSVDPGKFANDVHCRIGGLMKERGVPAITNQYVCCYVIKDGDYSKPYDDLFRLYMEPACQSIIDLAATDEPQPECRSLSSDAYGYCSHVAQTAGLRVEIQMGYDSLQAGTRVLVAVGPLNTVSVDRAVWEGVNDDALLLQCLEAAGIDNCEAYSIGYQEFVKAKQERDSGKTV